MAAFIRFMRGRLGRDQISTQSSERVYPKLAETTKVNPRNPEPPGTFSTVAQPHPASLPRFVHFSGSWQNCAVAGEQSVEDQLRHAGGLANVKGAKDFDYGRGTRHRTGNGAGTCQARTLRRRHRHFRAQWTAR